MSGRRSLTVGANPIMMRIARPIELGVMKTGMPNGRPKDSPGGGWLGGWLPALVRAADVPRSPLTL
jgi:hypothetical protein